jgi:hypothetical protein
VADAPAKTAAFYDLDGTLLNGTVVDHYLYYAWNDPDLTSRVQRLLKTAVSAPYFSYLDRLDRRTLQRGVLQELRGPLRGPAGHARRVALREGALEQALRRRAGAPRRRPRRGPRPGPPHRRARLRGQARRPPPRDRQPSWGAASSSARTAWRPASCARRSWPAPRRPAGSASSRRSPRGRPGSERGLRRRRRRPAHALHGRPPGGGEPRTAACSRPRGRTAGRSCTSTRPPARPRGWSPRGRPAWAGAWLASVRDEAALHAPDRPRRPGAPGRPREVGPRGRGRRARRATSPAKEKA